MGRVTFIEDDDVFDSESEHIELSELMVGVRVTFNRSDAWPEDISGSQPSRLRYMDAVASNDEMTVGGTITEVKHDSVLIKE